MPTQTVKNLLRIPSENGSPINEYRINHGHIEFRSLTSQGQPFSSRKQGWRMLGVGDIQLHFALKTAVAQWLIERLGAEPHDA
jgi:hypothetical protein